MDDKIKKTETITCNLRNPTPARRIIHDGITVDSANGTGGVQRQITVDPGATARGVTISKLIADELRERNRVKRDSDLVVLPVSSKDDDDKDAKTDDKKDAKTA